MLKRSNWKGPFVDEIIFNEIRLNNNKNFKTTSRNSVILPFLIGRTVKVYNGKFFIPVFIREEMIGHRLGEFVPTRLRHVYKKKKKGPKK